MRVLGPARLVDALGQWGLHEAEGRVLAHLSDETRAALHGPERLLTGVDIALQYRSPLVWRLLWAGPLGCLRIELMPNDAEALMIADGRPLRQWTDAVMADQGDSGHYVRRLATADASVSGVPLVCAGQVQDQLVRPPFIIFDGWHRVVPPRGAGSGVPARGLPSAHSSPSALTRGLAVLRRVPGPSKGGLMPAAMPLALVVAFVVFAGLVNTHQRHASEFRGSSREVQRALTVSAVAGSAVGLGMLVYYGAQTAWYWSVVMFGVSGVVGGSLFGLLDGLAGRVAGADSGQLVMSLVAFGWPAAAVWVYFLIRNLHR